MYFTVTDGKQFYRQTFNVIPLLSKQKTPPIKNLDFGKYSLQQIILYQYAGARRPGQASNTHLRISLGIPETRGGKAHIMYAVTVETRRTEQGRHNHLLSYI
jgi:hypothetical protein